MKRILSLLLAVLLLCLLTVVALAHEVPDLERAGSISLTMTYQGKAVPGGSLTLYRVGFVDSSNGDYYFTFTKDFEGCSTPITELSSPKLSEELTQIVKQKKLKGVAEQTMDKNGQVVFDDLELGLYLLIQKKAAPGYAAIAPFLVSVPARQEGSYLYDVNASPKVSLEPKPTEPPTTQPNLPQTGQTNWPVPVLAAAGLLLITGGVLLCTSGKKKSHEN